MPPLDVRASYPADVRALPRWRVRPPTVVRAPLLAGVRAPPYRRRVRPPHPHARPLADVHTLPPQCARPHRWWQNKIYKEGSLTSPLHHAWLCVLGLLCGLLA
jgi:hypothetical protein